MIQKFIRKQGKEIEAEQYTQYGKLVKGMCNSKSCFLDVCNKPHVHTIHDNQIVLLEVGDWVLPEPDGEHFYPVKQDIFENTYELASPLLPTEEVGIKEDDLMASSCTIGNSIQLIKENLKFAKDFVETHFESDEEYDYWLGKWTAFDDVIRILNNEEVNNITKR